MLLDVRSSESVRGWSGGHRGAPALLALCALGCSTYERPAAPVSPAAQSPHAAAAAFGAWLHGPNSAWSAKKAGSSPELLIGAACLSHLGCELSAPTLPQCSPEGALPSGYIEVQGSAASGWVKITLVQKH